VAYGVFADYCGDCNSCHEGRENVCQSRGMTYDPLFGGYNTHY